MTELLVKYGGSARASAARLLVAVLALLLIGLLVQVVTTTHLHPDDPYYYVARQGRNIALAVVLALACCAIGYRTMLWFATPMLLLTWVALAGLLIPSVGKVAGGSGRWYALGSLNVQPSELLKVILVIYLAVFCERRQKVIHTFKQGFLPAMGVVGVSGLLVLLEPDFGQAVFLVATCGVVLMINGLRATHLWGAMAVSVPLAGVLVASRWGYFVDRIEGFLQGSHYQVQQSLAYIAGGGLFGRGLGEGRGHLFVPEVRNDFAFVPIGEQAGLIGGILVVLLFLLVLREGMRIAFLARTRVGFSIAFGLTFVIVFQALLNLCVVSGILPPKGISLPFISYGGSNMLVSAVAAGLIAAVSADASPQKAPMAEHIEHHVAGEEVYA